MPVAFLQMPGIKGASADAQFKDWIPLESYQFGISRSGDGGTATGRSSQGSNSQGSAGVTEIVLTKLNDISTPKLQEAAVKGTHFGVVLLRVVRPPADGGEGGWTQTLEFRDAVISSWSMGSSGGIGHETFTLNFRGFSHKVEADPEAKKPNPARLRGQRGGQPASRYRSNVDY